MHHMFFSCTALTQVNVSSFNTAKVTDMSAMFYNCENLTAVDLSNFQTPKVTDMAFMFRGCSKLKYLDLRGFDTSNVTAMNVMFWSCSSLRAIYCTNSWNTSKVTNSAIMFEYCTSLMGGNGTTYNSKYVDKTYARLDGGASSPGYFTYKAAGKKGDVNGDGTVDVADIGAIIDVMAKSGNSVAADVNGDGTVDVADIGTVIDIMAANARQQLRFAPPA
jgi:surface protein